MRDDLHKKAPIPPKAQNVLKLALREADRNHPERLRAAARSALEQLVARNLSSPILHMLTEKQNQGELFGIAAAPRQACSPIEGDVLAGLARGFESRQSILEASLQTVCDSYIRESHATLIAERIGDATVVIEAFGLALRASASDVARDVSAGHVKSEVGPSLSLDEDLLDPGRSVKK